ncbi:hypothetical protein CRYUN_Cryun12cG0026600 [Craigia yunnanensis]
MGIKDQRLHAKMNIFKELVGQLVYMILGDTRYGERNWEIKIELVRKVIEQLKDPQFVLKLLMQLIIMKNKSSSLDVRKAESENIVLNQDCANEIHKSPPDSIPLNQNGGVQIKAKALQEAKEESQSIGEENMQKLANLEQQHQSVRELRAYAINSKMLHEVVDSCIKKTACDFLNKDCANLVQGHHGVEVEGEQLRLSVPQTPDSIQINQKGKNAEFHNQEFLATQRFLPAGNCCNSSDLESLTDSDWEFLTKLFMEDLTVVKTTNQDEGTSRAAENEVNVKLSPHETCIVQSYKVFNCNANALTEIFQKHPNIDENIRVASSDTQSHFMNSLAEVYQKIIKSQEILGLEDIKKMELMVGDMEYIGLQLTWLKERLAEIREMLENQEAHRKLVEEIDSYKTKKKEAKEKLARLEKKRRFQ